MRVEECNSHLLRLLFFSRCYWNKGSISLSKPVVSKNSPDYDPWVKDILKMNWDQQYSERPSTLQKSKDLIEKIQTRLIFWWISRPDFKLEKGPVTSAGRRCSIWNRWLRPSIFWRRITSPTMKHLLKKSGPPVKRVVCPTPVRGCYRPAPKDAGFHFVQATLPLPLSPDPEGSSYCWLPLKGSSYSFTLNLSCIISSFSWSWIYFLMVASLSPTVLT